MLGRVRTGWTSLACIALSLALGCDRRPPGLERAAVWSVGSLILAQRGEAELVALDADSGKRKWSHVHYAQKKSSVANARAPALLCAPQVDDDRVVLRYEDSVKVLAAGDGRVIWQRSCEPVVCPRFCVAAIDDGGVAVVTQAGRAVEILDRQGLPRWTHVAEGQDRVVDAPRFTKTPSSRIVVRTRNALTALTPRGQVIWTRPVAQD